MLHANSIFMQYVARCWDQSTIYPSCYRLHQSQSSNQPTGARTDTLQQQCPLLPWQQAPKGTTQQLIHKIGTVSAADKNRVVKKRAKVSTTTTANNTYWYHGSRHQQLQQMMSG